MSCRRIPAPAMLVVSAIYREERILESAVGRIAAVAGAVRFAGGVFPFDRTEYYSEEMGRPLLRRFLAASDPVRRDALPEIKCGLEGIERDLSEGGRRTVNLDPGLITPENFVLATGKNFSHRIYLRDGVYADLTLIFRRGGYLPLPWTYPDYASEEIRALLGELRRGHMSRKARGGSW